MVAIGGYFDIELPKGEPYHTKALCLNTGRNALEYILRIRNYTKVFIPYFTCEVILEPLHKLNLAYEFYRIDENLEPVFDYNSLGANDAFLCTNYFGIKDEFIDSISKRVPNLIVDNAQSFFSNPIENIDTFYSPRKFVGVSDGSYLYCDSTLDMEMQQDLSYARMSHLLIRADKNAEVGYRQFVVNDNSLINQNIQQMSKLTHRLLSSIDYDKIKAKRIENYDFLNKHLMDRNRLKLNRPKDQVPQTYPFWTKNAEIKKRLLENRIYCATYWPNVIEWCKADSLEARLATELVHLPIDQRYDIDDMRTIKELMY